MTQKRSYEYHIQLVLAALKRCSTSLKLIDLTCLEPPDDRPSESWDSLMIPVTELVGHSPGLRLVESAFKTYRRLAKTVRTRNIFAGRRDTFVAGVGTVELKVCTSSDEGSSNGVLALENVLHVPGAACHGFNSRRYRCHQVRSFSCHLVCSQTGFRLFLCLSVSQFRGGGRLEPRKFIYED